MSSSINTKRKFFDGATQTYPYADVLKQGVYSLLRSPKDSLQTAFSNNSTTVNEYYTLSLENMNTSCFAGFIDNLSYSYLFTKPSTSVEFHGINFGTSSTDSFYTIYNDPYGLLTFDDDYPTVQITGFVREQYNRKMILLGNNVNRATIDDEFHPEWWISKRFDSSSPFSSTPLVPENTLGDDHSSFLIMDRLGQKFYMSEKQQMLQEANGFRVNVYDTTTMKYEGTYNWTTHRPTTIESEISGLMPIDKHIIFNIEDKSLKIDLDGADSTGKIVITAGTTTLTITKDGDIDISGNNNLNITTSGNVVFQGGNKSVAADGDTVSIDSATSISISNFSATYAGTIPAGNMGCPIPVATILTFTNGTGSTITLSGGTLDSPNRKEKVE